MPLTIFVVAGITAVVDVSDVDVLLVPYICHVSLYNHVFVLNETYFFAKV